VAEHSALVRRGKWAESKDFCFREYPLIEIAGLTMGIVGLGRIGSAVARAAAAFGMEVVAFDPAPRGSPANIRMTDLETVFRESDVVSLHCPLTEGTRGFVNARLLGLMKTGAFLINTSRGPLIDETALADALERGRLAGAGLDVLESEPPGTDCPLASAENCFITPHIAWATLAARERLMKAAVANVRAFLRGERMNVVNRPRRSGRQSRDGAAERGLTAGAEGAVG
jgi:glycerate dehydrogenase